MNNIDLMKVLSKVNQNHKQQNTIYLLGGCIILTSIGLLYLVTKNQILFSNLKRTVGQNEILSSQLLQKTQH